MEQYIPKSALLAKIEKRIRACGNCYVLDELTSLHRTFNTLEVKEADLEKEHKDWLHQHFNGSRDHNASGDYLQRSSQLDMAKHFFELGMRVNNPITAADRGTAEEIIINLKRVESDYRINLTKEIEWIRNKVRKGE